MIITLVEQRLFLAEQYVLAGEKTEAANIVAQIHQLGQTYTAEQAKRFIQLCVTIQADEIFVDYFENQQPIGAEYLVDLIFAYARLNLFEQAQTLLEQIQIEAERQEVQQQLFELQQLQLTKICEYCLQEVQKATPNWEQVMSQLNSYPQLLQVEQIFEALNQAIEQSRILPPYLALVIDLAAQNQCYFPRYQNVLPIEKTAWIQEVQEQVQQVRCNQALLQQLVTWQLLQIYPETLNETEIMPFIELMKQQLQQMLAADCSE